MGWWQTYDGTVIGDGLADIVDNYRDLLVLELIADFPEVTREQILHTIAFCFNYMGQFDFEKERTDDTSMLVVMPNSERKRKSSGLNDPGTDAVAEGLMNVKSPFEGET